MAILPVEIMQLAVNVFPAENMKECVHSYHVFQYLKSYTSYVHLRLPYNLAKKIFAFALMSQDVSLAQLSQSRRNEPLYFQDRYDPLILETNWNFQNNSKLLDLLEKECSFTITYYDYRKHNGQNITHENEAFMWWVQRGYKFWKNYNEEELMYIIEKYEKQMEKFFVDHMTASIIGDNGVDMKCWKQVIDDKDLSSEQLKVFEEHGMPFTILKEKCEIIYDGRFIYVREKDGNGDKFILTVSDPKGHPFLLHVTPFVPQKLITKEQQQSKQ